MSSTFECPFGQHFSPCFPTAFQYLAFSTRSPQNPQHLRRTAPFGALQISPRDGGYHASGLG
jgi:hypothetical protein